MSYPSYPAEAPASGESVAKKPSFAKDFATPRWNGNNSPPGVNETPSLEVSVALGPGVKRKGEAVVPENALHMNGPTPAELKNRVYLYMTADILCKNTAIHTSPEKKYFGSLERRAANVLQAN